MENITKYDLLNFEVITWYTNNSLLNKKEGFAGHVLVQNRTGNKLIRIRKSLGINFTDELFNILILESIQEYINKVNTYEYNKNNSSPI